MEVNITGRPRNITKKETREVLEWIARELRVNHYKTPLSININFKKDLKKKTGYKGSAIWDDDNHRPKQFTVEIDAGISYRLSVTTLIHEMVHVKQYAKGQLKDLLRNFSLKRWGTKLIDEEKIAYKQLPWEKEAYRLEKIYYKNWKAYKRKNH